MLILINVCSMHQHNIKMCWYCLWSTFCWNWGCGTDTLHRHRKPSICVWRLKDGDMLVKIKAIHEVGKNWKCRRRNEATNVCRKSLNKLLALNCVVSSVSRSGLVWFFSLFWTRPGPDRSSEISFLGKNRTGLGKTGLHRSGLRYLSALNRLRPRPV